MKIYRTVRQQAIAKTANNLLATNKESRPPIDVARLAKKLKLKVVFDELEDDVSGFLLTEGKTPYVGVNNKHSPHRQRFTIAHEIAHFLLHSKDGKALFVDRPVYFRNVASSSGENQQEIEANYFAAELLMPETLLKEELQKYGDDLTEEDVKQLADTFQVSPQAMSFRLAKLNVLRSF